MRHRVWLASVAALTIAAPSFASIKAQSLSSRIDAVRDGNVDFTFATRPGVCGDGRGSVWTNQGRTFDAGRDHYTCVAGPARVTISKSDAQVVTVRACVACASRAEASTDVRLGDVSPSDASHYLLRIARTFGGSSASEAVAAAAFADAGDIGPELTTLVRDDDATLVARKSALFWLGQTDTRTQDLVQVYPSLKPVALREHYTFVLSQRRDDDVAIDKLIDVAQHDTDMQIRKQAMFLLGQTKNPKAIKFFQSILTR
jgi:hypothetical protein